MGTKFTDIVMRGHDHQKLMNDLHTFKFKQFLLSPPKKDAVIIKEQLYPMMLLQAIDVSEVLEYGDHSFADNITVVASSKIPVARLKLCDSRIFEHKFAEYLSVQHPQSRVVIFRYHSVSDGAGVDVYQNGKLVQRVYWSDDRTQDISSHEGVADIFDDWMMYIRQKNDEENDNSLLIASYQQRWFSELPAGYFILDNTAPWDDASIYLQHLQTFMSQRTDEDPRFSLLEGDLLATLGRYEEAIIVFKKAKRLDNGVSIFSRVAFAEYKLGKIEEALSGYRQAVSEGSWHVLPYIAAILLEQNKATHAIEYCNQCIEKVVTIAGKPIGSTCALAYYNRACAEAKLGRPDEAIYSFSDSAEGRYLKMGT